MKEIIVKRRRDFGMLKLFLGFIIKNTCCYILRNGTSLIHYCFNYIDFVSYFQNVASERV